MLVVVFHTGAALPGGFVGVDVFFVISGYVITRMLMREFDRTDRISFRSFYLRRIRRIMPPLALMLAVVMLLSVLLAPIGGQRMTAKTGVAAALLNANTYLARYGAGGYFDVDASLNALLHTWSLSVEEQFYLFFPALIALAWWGARRTGRLKGLYAITAMLVAVGVVSFGLSWMLSTGHSGLIPLEDYARPIAFYSSQTRAWEFVAGGLLVAASGLVRRLPHSGAVPLGVAGLTLVFYASVTFDDLTPFPGTAALVPVIGTLLLISAGEIRASNVLTNALSWKPVQRVGDLSYSWYLWHWPVIVFGAALFPGRGVGVAVAAAIVSIGPAVLSYRFVENPIRFMPHPRAKRTLALASACIAVPLVAGLVLLLGHRTLIRTDRVSTASAGLEPHLDLTNGCNDPTPLGDRVNFDCTWPATGGTSSVVLIGDSNAGHLVEGVIAGGTEAGDSITVATLAGCPFADVVSLRNHGPIPGCDRFVSESVADLVSSPPDAVMLASASDNYIELSEVELIDPDTGERASSPDSKAEVWSRGLDRTVSTLERAGIDVIIIEPVPKFGDWDPQNCAAVHWLVGNGDVCGATESRAEADAFRDRAVSAERGVGEHTTATVVDVADDLCIADLCATRLGDTWMWKNGGHISVDASAQLSGRFRDLLASLPR